MARQDWETPSLLFSELNKEFDFKLDAAANAKNTKCHNYFDESINGLTQPWENPTWLNPPYGNIAPWAYKAIQESYRGNTTVMLVPSNRSDQQWWIDLWPHCEVRWIRGRVKFVGATGSPPFAVCLLIVKGKT